MKVKKQCPKEERRKKLLSRLQCHESVPTRELLAELNISKATLSDDKRALSRLGYRFETPKNGYLRLLPEGSDAVTYPIAPPLKQADFRCWLNLLFLWQSETPLTIDQILDSYSELFGYYSERSVRKQLNEMIDEGWVEHIPHNRSSEHDIYRRLKAAPALLALDESDLDMFCYSFSQYGESDPLYQTLQPFYLKACTLMGGEYDGSRTFRVHGRLLPPDSLQKQLDIFLQYPYHQKVLRLSYKAYPESCETCLFATGLLVFSVEKNRFYLLGEAEQGRIIIPVDAIQQIELTDEKNQIYNSLFYRKLFTEMFSVSVDDPYDVRVRFQDKFNIREKVESLRLTRPKARLETVPGKEEFIYTDTIRGLNDFAHYLRSFGSSAIAEEPAELREKMIDSSRKVMENYERTFHFE